LAQSCAHPGHGFGQALGFCRLEDVVHRAVLKRLDRVLVIGGDEHHLGCHRILGVCPVDDGPCGVNAVQGRHADVEEHHIGPALLDRLQRFLTVARQRLDAQLRPDLLQGQHQLFAHQALVIGQNGPHCTGVHADGPSATDWRARR
jgi:hypothetical protein